MKIRQVNRVQVRNKGTIKRGGNKTKKKRQKMRSKSEPNDIRSTKSLQEEKETKRPKSMMKKGSKANWDQGHRLYVKSLIGVK